MLKAATARLLATASESCWSTCMTTDIRGTLRQKLAAVCEHSCRTAAPQWSTWSGPLATTSCQTRSEQGCRQAVRGASEGPGGGDKNRQQEGRDTSALVRQALGAAAAAALLCSSARGQVACGPIEKKPKGTVAMAPSLDTLISCDAIGAPPRGDGPQKRQNSGWILHRMAKKARKQAETTAQPKARPQRPAEPIGAPPRLAPTSKSRPTSARPSKSTSSSSSSGKAQRPITAFTSSQASSSKMPAAKPAKAPRPPSSAAAPGILKIDVTKQAQTLSWVTRVMQAAMLDVSKLPSLLSEAAQLTASATIMQSTGAGVALGTAWVWESLDPARQKRRAALLATWKLKLRQEVQDLKASAGRALLPKKLRKSLLLQAGWSERLQEMESWFRCLDEQGDAGRVHSARLAIRLLLAGFRSIDELAGLTEAAQGKVTNVPKELSMLSRAVSDMDTLKAQSRATQLRQKLGVAQPEGRGPRSAWDLAATLSVEELRLLDVSTQELSKELGISLQQGPRSATHQLIAAKKAGRTSEVEQVLRDRELQLRLSQQRKSLPQVASGLKAWHLYATGILGYSEEATLPPYSSEHVCGWLTLFANPGTAANYLSYLRWACREFRKDLSWSDSAVASLLKSMKKVDLHTRISQMPEGVRLAESDVYRLGLLAWELGDPEFGILTTLSYSFLFRVASECIPLEIGTAAEAVSPLPEGRHSGIYVANGKLHVRLRSRKNRPQGSLLIRECNCGALQEPRLCPVHCFDWQQLNEGDRLFTLTNAAARHRLRRYATMLALPGAARVTLKVFRASRATALALQGRPIHHILEAGEWRSAAMLRYVSADALDTGSLLTQSVLEEDSD